MNKPISRSVPWLVLTGNVALLLGLAWDAALHTLDPGLAARESIVTLANPSHALFAVGLGLVTLGTLLFVFGRMTRPGLSRTRRAALSLPVAGLLLLSFAGLGAAASQSTMTGHHHDHTNEPALPPTAAEQAAADRLVVDTRIGASRFADFTVAESAGYVELNPRLSRRLGRSHYINRAYLTDGALLDPERPEGLVYLHGDNGERLLIGSLYIAQPGHGPDIGGPLTDWHTHDNLCAGGPGLLPKLPLIGCPPGSVPIAAEMMHVWLFDHPAGPFADALDPVAIAVARLQLS